jgi:hypothetical protein
MAFGENVKLYCNAPLVLSVEKSSASESFCADLLYPVFSNPAAEQTEVEECIAEWVLPPEYAHCRAALGGANTGEAASLCQADCDSKNSSDAFILLRSDSGKYLLAGTVTWRKLLMTWSLQNSRLSLCIHGDALSLAGNSRYDADEFVFLERDTIYDAMDAYGQILSARNSRKRKNDLWSGWASWDYFRDDFTHAELMEQLEAVKPLLPAKDQRRHHLLQVDDGYCVWGDWLELKDGNFPNGFAGLVQDATSRGFDTGIWMAPFWAESTSQVAQAHPEWFLRDGNGDLIQQNMVTHTLVLFDYSQDEVCEWWRETLKTVLSWGVVYFKFDFLSRGLCPVPGKNPMPPLARFHRCFDIISEVLDPADCYILGCSATLGPCFGRVDGIRIGPDIFPAIQNIRNAAFACTGHFYLQKHVLDCDSDYLVVRGENDHDPAHKESRARQIGRVSADEARTWSRFSAIDAHIVLAADNMKFLSEQKKAMVREVMAQKPGDEIFALDFLGGDSTTAAECILSNHDGEIYIDLFNWDDTEKTTVLSGPQTGTYTIAPNSVHTLKYTGNCSFAELARTLRTNRAEIKRKTYQNMIGNFPAPCNAECLPLGKQADYPLKFDRKKQLGMPDGKFEPLLSRNVFSGVPFDFSLNQNKVLIQTFHEQQRREIEVSGKIPVFYLLYCVCIPVRNRVCGIELHFTNGTKAEFSVDCSENIGNFDIRYLFDWKGRDAHLCWIDDATFACMYTARFVNPCPEKTVTKIVTTELEQQGTFYIAGLTRADN